MAEWTRRSRVASIRGRPDSPGASVPEVGSVVPRIAAAMPLVSTDNKAYAIGAATPAGLGLVLLIGGLVALLRISHRDKAAQSSTVPSPVPGNASGPHAMPPYG